MALCNITGTVYLPSGELARSTRVIFSRADKSVRAEYLGAVIPVDTITQTNSAGEIDVSLLTGRYVMFTGTYSGGAVVPEALTANIADVLTIITPSVPVPAWLTQALEARDAAIAAADDAQDSADAAAGSAATAATAGATAGAAAAAPFAAAAAASADDASDFADDAFDSAAAAALSASDAAGSAASFQTYASYAAALAAAPTLAATVRVVSANVNGTEARWVRQTGGTALGGGWEPADNFYSPLHFGAVGNGVTDDGAAINAALAAYRTKVNGVPSAIGSLDFDLCGRVYVTTVSLDATGLSSSGWGIKNGTIIGKCTGKAVLDMIGSRGGEVANLIVYGDKINMPSVGIQAARSSAGGQTAFCDNCLWSHVMTRGYFSTAGVWIYGQETTTYLHCAFWNYNPLGACAFHVGTSSFEYNGVSPMLMQSDYLAPMVGETSYINNSYINCDWRYLPIGNIYNGTAVTRGTTTVFTTTFPPTNFTVGHTVVFQSEGYQTAAYGTSGVITAISGNDVTVAIDSSGWAAHTGETFSLIAAQTGPTVVFGRGRDHNFQTCYIVSYGDYALDVVFGENGVHTMDKINFDFLFEGSGPGYIRFRNDRAGVGLASGSITTYQVRCNNHVISAPGPHPILLHDVRISVPGARHRTPLMFDDPAKYQIAGGSIYVYQVDRLPRSGWSLFRTRVTDRQGGITMDYGQTTAGNKDMRQIPGSPPRLDTRFIDALGTIKGFSAYDVSTQDFSWSPDGLTTAAYLAAGAFYPGVDGTVDLGIASRRWRHTNTNTITVHGGVLNIGAVPVYANNAAAVTGGLAAGRVYKTVTGELRIVV